MKILIFSLAYFPHVGGAEIAIKEVTDRIPDAEFHLITLRFNGEPPEEKIGNVFVHRVGRGGSYLEKVLFVPRAASLARELHAQRSFDAVWAMMTYMVLPVALLRLSGARIPYLVNLQDGDPFGSVFRRWFILPLRPLLLYGLRRASVIVPISSYLGEWAAKVGYRGQVEVIPNGVDLSHFTHTHTHARSMENLTLITTSRLVYKNAVDDVIRALVLLPDSVRFRIYGVGKEEKVLRALAKELRVDERVEFKGFLEHEKLPEALNNADIFVRPSRSEGLGISFVEAMAVGLPVIATQEGGIKDFLFDVRRNGDKKATGWAVDVNAPEQIATAVKDIVTNPEKTSATVENAVRLVREHYNWDTVARRLEEVFKRIVRPSTMAV